MSAEPKKILMVDDEEDFGRMVAINLEKSGLFKVRVEKLGSQALSSAQEFGPDLILLDVMMRDMAGPAVAGVLRQDAKLKKVPIVFLSAAAPKDGPETRQMAGYPCLSKPVQTEQLIAFIQKHLPHE